MTTTIPAWARALLLADRAVHSSVRLAALVRTELLLAGLSTAEREAVNAAVFSAEDTYSPGRGLGRLRQRLGDDDLLLAALGLRHQQHRL